MASPTELYLEKLIEGSAAGIEALFSGLPWIDDPFGSKVRDASDLHSFVAERHAWLAERSATSRQLRTTQSAHRAVTESLLLLAVGGTIIELPVAVAADLADDGTRVRAIRAYHSFWPLEGAHRVRPPLLPHDPTLHLADVIAEYQQALATGDSDGILHAFEPDGYFREPSGGDYVFRGPALREFMESLLGGGGIGLEHCAATDDGMACALEFNAVRFGAELLDPQAGIAVYERGQSGRLAAARVYDDVNVEALAPR